MKNYHKLLFGSIITATLLFTGCTNYTQEDIDALNSRIAELENENTELASLNAELQATIEEYENADTVPAGMSEAVYAYGKTVLEYCDNHLAGSISAQELYDNIKPYASKLLLGDRSNLNPIDSECCDYIIGVFSKISHIVDGEDMQEDFLKYRNALAKSLGKK